jgi:hypothetical protein
MRREYLSHRKDSLDRLGCHDEAVADGHVAPAASANGGLNRVTPQWQPGRPGELHATPYSISNGIARITCESDHYGVVAVSSVSIVWRRTGAGEVCKA